MLLRPVGPDQILEGIGRAQLHTDAERRFFGRWIGEIVFVTDRHRRAIGVAGARILRARTRGREFIARMSERLFDFLKGGCSKSLIDVLICVISKLVDSAFSRIFVASIANFAQRVQVSRALKPFVARCI